jgi:sortase (surface protein transpeptidase)
MDVWTLHQYAQAKASIEAKEIRRQLMIADWPHYQKNDRSRIDSELSKQADPFKNQNKARPLTEDEIKAIIGGLNG